MRHRSASHPRYNHLLEVIPNFVHEEIASCYTLNVFGYVSRLAPAPLVLLGFFLHVPLFREMKNKKGGRGTGKLYKIEWNEIPESNFAGTNREIRAKS